MFAFIAQGMGFGFAAGTSPGPLQTFLISTTLGRGWRRGILVIFGPLLSDVPIILLMTVLLHQLPGEAVQVIRVAGGFFVLWLAWNTWQALPAGTHLAGKPANPSTSGRQTLLQAAAINTLNPNPYIYWGSVTGPILLEGLEQSAGHGAVFLAGFYGVFLVVMAAMVFAIDRLRRLDERITRAILLLTILILAGLGLSLVIDGIFG